MTATATARTYTSRGASVVSRTIVDTGTTMFFEIAVLRSHRQHRPTYQGTVVLRDGSWHAEAATRTVPVTIGVFGDYADAEAALVARRTGIVSSQQWTGTRPVAPVRPSCDICGWDLAAGECRRTDLHWTTTSLTA